MMLCLAPAGTTTAKPARIAVRTPSRTASPVPVLRYFEKVIHPRWPTPFEATKRLVGTVVVILNTTLIFTPIPLSNVVPAVVITLISLAYLEEDGLLLTIALLAAVIVLGIEFVAIRETVVGAKWIIGLW